MERNSLFVFEINSVPETTFSLIRNLIVKYMHSFYFCFECLPVEYFQILISM